MAYDSLIFDLDGTLWDTSEACAIAWNTVLSGNGIAYRPITADDVRAVTGRPHEECIRMTFADLPPEQIALISKETMTEDNAVISRMGGVLYPGVAEGLAALHERYRLFIVSNCQSGYIETFFEFSGLGRLFEDFECWGNTGNPKGQNVAAVIDRNGLKHPVMIGDAEGDEKAARENHIPFAFCEYGFGAGQEPEWSFKQFSDLVTEFAV